MSAELDEAAIRARVEAAVRIRREIPAECHGGPGASYSPLFIENAIANHAPGDADDPDLRRIWEADSEVMAAAFSDVPLLLAALDEARAERDAAIISRNSQQVARMAERETRLRFGDELAKASARAEAAGSKVAAVRLLADNLIHGDACTFPDEACPCIEVEIRQLIRAALATPATPDEGGDRA